MRRLDAWLSISKTAGFIQDTAKWTATHHGAICEYRRGWSSSDRGYRTATIAAGPIIQPHIHLMSQVPLRYLYCGYLASERGLIRLFAFGLHFLFDGATSLSSFHDQREDLSAPCSGMPISRKTSLAERYPVATCPSGKTRVGVPLTSSCFPSLRFASIGCRQGSVASAMAWPAKARSSVSA
jgi:hypothetical protein